MFKYVVVIAALVELFLLSGSQALAQGYPNKPVRVVVPFPPGSGTDLITRLVADRLARKWSQQVLVDNRPGAASIIGSEIVAKAPPDGYTLLLTLSNHASNPKLYAKLPYDTERDFQPVTQVGSSPMLMLVNPALNLKSVKELVELSKRSAQGLSFGSVGSASPSHLAGELLKLMSGANLVHVPYKGGPQATTDVANGGIAFYFSAIAQGLPLARAGKVQGLAISTGKRWPTVPDVPTVEESAGLAGYDMDFWYGLFAPGKTPDALVAQINRDVVEVLNDPELRERFVNAGVAPRPSTPAEFREFVSREIARWGKLIGEIGLKLE